MKILGNKLGSCQQGLEDVIRIAIAIDMTVVGVVQELKTLDLNGFSSGRICRAGHP